MVYYIQQPHAVFVPGTQQVVVAFVAQNSIWAFSASVEHLQAFIKSTTLGPAAKPLGEGSAERPKEWPRNFVASVIFSGAGTSSWPRVSPDGQQIAFSNDQSGDSEIYVVSIASVPLSASGDTVAVQSSGQPRRITYLSSSSFSVGWSSATDFTTQSIGGEHVHRSAIHFASDYRMTNVASETIWAVDPAGGNPRSGQLGESDFYNFCEPLQLHIVGRFTRDTHCTKTWKVRTLDAWPCLLSGFRMCLRRGLIRHCFLCVARGFCDFLVLRGMAVDASATCGWPRPTAQAPS